MLGSPGQQNPNQPRVPNFVDSYQHYLGLHQMPFKAGALAFYILSALFFNSFVIIFVVTVLLAALECEWSDFSWS
ncbi:hypothetical protein OIU84_016521 [Salix udensis]|uniref:PRA1 family protein n=1 Tax=Salix udensis TaxID=889485 RepID=A0AAD6J9N0_9ROSI|nr:hypothetical protein OIU84_016521 [Salix udensis]